jgi:excisionase family DNA binding protein
MISENVRRNTESKSSKRADGRANGGINSELEIHKFFENKIAYEPRISLENVRWLTTSEAAQYLRVSISSLKTMVCRGQVRRHKLGRRNRFLRDELERMIILPISR